MRATRDRTRRVLRVLVFAAAIALLCLAALDTRLQISHYTLQAEGLPAAFDGLRIAVVADPHGSGMQADSALAELLGAQQADIIVLLGDMLDEDAPDMEAFGEFLARITAPAPVFAVSGNHDRWNGYYKELAAVYGQAGVHFLEDGDYTLWREGESIRLVGFADPETWSAETESGCMDGVMEKLPPSGQYDILLFHRATLFDEIAEAGYELVLSGHLHGGVVRVPFFGPLFSHLPVGDTTYAGGQYSAGDTTLIVSRGLGNSVAVPRVCNRPELVIITLKGQE